jgi:hypothetical protein
MTYYITDPIFGYPAIAGIASTLGQVPMGKIVRATDSTYGEGEFIFLKGASSTIVGSLVTYNATTGVTALSPTDATGNGNPVAVAMAANVNDTNGGWYQIAGLAVIKKTAVAITPQVQIAVSGTAGRVYATYSAGKGIANAKSANLTTVVAGTSTVAVRINRPFIESI